MDLKESMDAFRALMLDGDYGARDAFRKCYVTHEYDVKGDRPIGTVEFGGKTLETPQSLYRLLFLAKPSRVDFSDMYKSSSLFALCSPDYRFVADLIFWKYWPALRFDAVPECLQGGLGGIVAGSPDAKNGITSKDPLLDEWCALLVTAATHEWTVYGGNNFVV